MTFNSNIWDLLCKISAFIKQTKLDFIIGRRLVSNFESCSIYRIIIVGGRGIVIAISSWPSKLLFIAIKIIFLLVIAIKKNICGYRRSRRQTKYNNFLLRLISCDQIDQFEAITLGSAMKQNSPVFFSAMFAGSTLKHPRTRATGPTRSNCSPGPSRRRGRRRSACPALPQGGGAGGGRTGGGGRRTRRTRGDLDDSADCLFCCARQINVFSINQSIAIAQLQMCQCNGRGNI